MMKRNLLAVFVFMVGMFVVSLCVSTVASAQGKDVPNGKGFQALQEQIDDLYSLQGWYYDSFGMVATDSSIKIGNDSAECTTDNAGTMRFNNGAFEGCDGTAWVSLIDTIHHDGWHCGVDQVEDEDGNWYDTVQIGSQCWMAENLNVGTMVHFNSVQTNNTVVEKYCHGNDLNNCASYGGLYQWNEMMLYSTYAGGQGICPTDWHLPTDEEWKTLELGQGETQAEVDSLGWRGAIVSLMAGGSSGFEMLLTGVSAEPGGTQALYTYGFYWASTKLESVGWGMYPVIRKVLVDNYARGAEKLSTGCSVRCVRD